MCGCVEKKTHVMDWHKMCENAIIIISAQKHCRNISFLMLLSNIDK
jgi:hypothetical protein